MFEWLENRFKSAYLRMLEAECARLRDENRQLVNSLLRHNGLDPVVPADRQKQDGAAQGNSVHRFSWQRLRAKKEMQSNPAYIAQQNAMAQQLAERAKTALRQKEGANASVSTR